MTERRDAEAKQDRTAPRAETPPEAAPREAPDMLNEAEVERRAAREGRDAAGRPLRGEETAPGERGDGPYGDSEPGPRQSRPGTSSTPSS